MAKARGLSPNNLRASLTSFIGREREIAETTRLLAATRLLTLTGTGGCGKSRLALEVARALMKDFSDGVWAVEQAPLSEPRLSRMRRPRTWRNCTRPGGSRATRMSSRTAESKSGPR